MHKRSSITTGRRQFLTRSALAAGAMLGTVPALSSTAHAAEVDKHDGTVRDRLWLWTHPAGSHNGIKLADGSRGWSRMTPVEGALYMGLHNIYFIHWEGSPALEHYDYYATAFKPMKRVIWSLSGAGGESSLERRKRTLAVAKRNPNVAGFIFDDFLHFSHTQNTHWLAANQVEFPVTLTLTGDKPVTLDRLQLVQSEWPTGDYRTAEIKVMAIVDGGHWEEVHEATMPDEMGAMLNIPLPTKPYVGLRVRVLGSHDKLETQAESCGLGGLRTFLGDDRVLLNGWNAHATSEYGDEYKAQVLLAKDVPNGAPVPASMTPEELAALRPELDFGDGRTLPLVCVVYTHQLSPRINAHVRHMDKVTMWTWKSAGLVNLEVNFEKLTKLAKKPIILGCYLYDYGFDGDEQPMPLERMKYQCELGLKWLKEGRIESMIFLASNVCDMNLEAVEWTRQWIDKVGDQRLQD